MRVLRVKASSLEAFSAETFASLAEMSPESARASIVRARAAKLRAASARWSASVGPKKWVEYGEVFLAALREG